MAVGTGFSIHKKRVSSNFVPSIYHIDQQLQQFTTKYWTFLKYDQYLELRPKVEQSVNEFKDSFFSSSKSENITALQFKDG